MKVLSVNAAIRSWADDSKVQALSILLVIISGMLGIALGYSMGSGDKQGAIDVWEWRAEEWRHDAVYWEQQTANAQVIIDRKIEVIDALKAVIQETGETIVLLEEANLHLAEYEERIEAMTLALETLQEEHVRLQLAYQDLWEFWWDETH